VEAYYDVSAHVSPVPRHTSLARSDVKTGGPNDFRVNHESQHNLSVDGGA